MSRKGFTIVGGKIFPILAQSQLPFFDRIEEFLGLLSVIGPAIVETFGE